MSSPYGPGTVFCSECGRPSTADELARFGDRLVCPMCKESYAQKLREGVAPAAASRYAGFWNRVLAWLIDTIILMVVGSVVQFAFLGSFVTIPNLQPGADPTAALAGMMGMIG